MKFVLTLLLMLPLIGCGTIQDEFVQAREAGDIYVPVPGCPMRALAYIHDATFTGYLQQFQQDAVDFEVGCYRTRTIYFDSDMPSDRTLAYCIPGNKIVVHKGKWDKLSAMERKTLMYHELGHCALNLDHVGERDFDIMAPDILYPADARRHWNTLVTALFERAQEEQR